MDKIINIKINKEYRIEWKDNKIIWYANDVVLMQKMRVTSRDCFTDSKTTANILNVFVPPQKQRNLLFYQNPVRHKLDVDEYIIAEFLNYYIISYQTIVGIEK